MSQKFSPPLNQKPPVIPSVESTWKNVDKLRTKRQIKMHLCSNVLFFLCKNWKKFREAA